MRNAALSVEPKDLALHRSEGLAWEKGMNSFEGMEVSYVSRTSSTGGFAAFHRAKKTKIPHHKGQLHAHTSTSHTIVLQGIVSAEFNGQTYTLKAGDYFRCPAGLGHVGSHIVSDALMFVFSDGPMEMDFKPPAVRKSLTIGPTKAATAPAIFSGRSLPWKRGSGSFKDMEIALLSQDKKSGIQVLMHKAKKSPDLHHGGKPHSHSSTSHTLVMSGAVGAEFDGWSIYAKQGDYVRCPAGMIHTGSHIIDDTRMWVVTEGSFDLVMTKN